ncbi:MAG TPA: hypothetical protein VHW96_15695 [Solirubrobacteraceae bacterium]|nr:hypothetical protein [Solirubrobacteraceae bacterium]
MEVKGHRAAMWEASWRTPGLVAEYGLAYDSSLMDSDTPYVLETDEGAIAELPPCGGSTTPSRCRRPTSRSGDARPGGAGYLSAARAWARTAALTRSSAPEVRRHCCQ